MNADGYAWVLGPEGMLHLAPATKDMEIVGRTLCDLPAGPPVVTWASPYCRACWLKTGEAK